MIGPAKLKFSSYCKATNGQVFVPQVSEVLGSERDERSGPIKNAWENDLGFNLSSGVGLNGQGDLGLDDNLFYKIKGPKYWR